jgi:hypothetical protein
MDVSTLLAIIVIVAASMSSIMILIPKLAKYKWAMEAGKAVAESLAASRSPTDDTPGVITPAEYAEAIEAGAKAAKNALGSM